jgi:hypothetical protein
MQYRNIVQLYKQALTILSQVANQQLLSPQVSIEPFDELIDKATKILMVMNSNYFKGDPDFGTVPNKFMGVSKIVIAVSDALGFVESGKDKDPAKINLNMNEIKNRMNAQTDPELKKNEKANAIVATALVIAHERGHIASYDPQKGFVGGESPALTEEAKVKQWIEANKQNPAILQILK